MHNQDCNVVPVPGTAYPAPPAPLLALFAQRFIGFYTALTLAPFGLGDFLYSIYAQCKAYRMLHNRRS